MSMKTTRHVSPGRGERPALGAGEIDGDSLGFGHPQEPTHIWSETTKRPEGRDVEMI
jgi:hypothetical protein